MSHILVKNIDRKLIIVSVPLFSGSLNLNMAIILVFGGCGSHTYMDTYIPRREPLHGLPGFRTERP